MFHSLLNDRIIVIKKDGRKFEDVKAQVSSKSVFIGDSKLPLEEGDTILRDLENGLIERFAVIDRGFIKGIGGIPSHYEAKVRREGSITHEQMARGISIHGDNARININSHDSSVNIKMLGSEDLFAQLKVAIKNQVSDPARQEEAMTRIEALESTKGTKAYLEHYRNFIAVLSDHIGVISPFIPALSQWLSD